MWFAAFARVLDLFVQRNERPERESPFDPHFDGSCEMPPDLAFSRSPDSGGRGMNGEAPHYIQKCSYIQRLSIYVISVSP